MKRPLPFSRVKPLLLGGMLALVVGALTFILLRYQAAAEQEHKEFVHFARSAAVAARTGDLAEMRRLYLNDAFLEDKALRLVFADFARLREEDLDTLEPDYEGETYCWLRLPDSHTRHKLVRAHGDWVIQGDVVPLDR
ncbi:MAG: hypothetical protein H7067_18725 [Burkholderiales bacterium]|nr:hypothetical protein [Opitutaceae bacterium]